MFPHTGEYVEIRGWFDSPPTANYKRCTGELLEWMHGQEADVGVERKVTILRLK